MPAPRQPDRLHLVHHALPHVPAGRWYSAFEFARCVYLGRGRPVTRQVERVEELLEMAHHAGLLDRHDELTVCTLYRRNEESESPPDAPDAPDALAERLRAALAHHAARPLTDEDRRLLPVIGEATREIGAESPVAGQYTAAGEPVVLGSVPSNNHDSDYTADEPVRVCPPHLAAFQRQDAGWKPRAWRPQVDTAVMQAWLARDPDPRHTGESIDFASIRRRLEEARCGGGPQGYPVTFDLIEEVREALAHFHRLRDENARLRRELQEAVDLRNALWVRKFIHPAPETAVDRRRNAFWRRYWQAHFDGTFHDMEPT